MQKEKKIVPMPGLQPIYFVPEEYWHCALTYSVRCEHEKYLHCSQCLTCAAELAWKINEL